MEFDIFVSIIKLYLTVFATSLVLGLFLWIIIVGSDTISGRGR